MLLIFIGGLILGFLAGVFAVALVAKGGLQRQEKELYRTLGENSGLLAREPSD